MRRQNNFWSEEDIERLKVLIASGASPNRAAVVLKRTRAAVQGRARQLGMPFPHPRDVRKRLLALTKNGGELGSREGVLQS
jgi:hypothetical protein